MNPGLNRDFMCSERVGPRARQPEEIEEAPASLCLLTPYYPPNDHQGEDGSRHRHYRINYCFFSILRNASLRGRGRPSRDRAGVLYGAPVPFVP